MATAIKSAINRLFDQASKSQGAMKRILNPSPEGAGSRVYPSKTRKNDKSPGVRIDKGEPVDGKPGFIRLKLQANSQAENATIKGLAQKDSHAVISYADVDTEREPEKDYLLQVKNQFLENVQV